VSMEYGRDQHFQAVGFAGAEVAELEALILAAKLKAEDVIGTVVIATGEGNAVESARNAVDFASAIPERLAEVIGMCETVKAELLRYGGGF
jgi:hypothetical protein